MKIILGSSSPWRREIMQQIMPEFEVMIPDIDEKSIRNTNPNVLVSKIAMAKAQALIPRLQGTAAVLLTADQVTVCNGEIREKPQNIDEGRRFLRSYRTLPLVCVNAVYAYNLQTRQEALTVSTAKVWLRGLTDEVVEHLLISTVAMQCAGACAAGHPTWVPYVERIEGGMDDLYGLPVEITKASIATVSEV